MGNDSYWEQLANLYDESQNAAIRGMNAPSPLSTIDTGGYSEADASPGPREYGGTANDYRPQEESGTWGKAAGAFAKSLVPSLGQAGAAMLFAKMFPGVPGTGRAMDMRTPEMQAGSQMAMSRLQALEKNPNSFGLPGDPNDPNTPAGKRLYQIRANSRAASAATGGLETGGHAIREEDAVNRAIGNEFNNVYNSGFSNLANMNPQAQFNYRLPQENPWARILTTAIAPGIGKGLEGALNTDAIKRWFI